jgi:hypothetical protein
MIFLTDERLSSQAVPNGTRAQAKRKKGAMGRAKGGGKRGKNGGKSAMRLALPPMRKTGEM